MRPVSRYVLFGAALLAPLGGCGGTAQPGAGAAPSPASTTFVYGPFNATYEGVSHGVVEQMGQTIEVGVRYFVTAAAVRAGGAARLSLLVDSIPELIGQGTTPADAAAAQGLLFTGLLDATGEIMNFQGGDEGGGTFLQQLRTGFERFFPQVPEGGAAPGAIWVDTTETTGGGEGVDIAVQTVIRSEAVDWVDYGGVRALLVNRVASYTLSGAGNQMGTEFTIDGTGTRHEQQYLGANGTYLGGTVADTSNATALVTAMGMEIPIRQIQHDTLRVVR